MTISAERTVTIMNELKQNNTSHFPELYEVCKKQLSASIYKNNYQFSIDWDAEDYQDDVVTEIWKDRDNFDENRASFSTWLNMKGKNIYVKHYNSEKKKIVTVPMFTATEEGEEVNIIDSQRHVMGIDNQILRAEAVKMISDNLSTLPKKHQEAFILCRINGEKPAKVAKFLGCSSADISRWNNRTAEKLKQYIIEEELEESLLLQDVA